MPLTARLAAIAVVAAVALACAAPAGASFHFMRVNEVMLSTGGNGDAQFVELLESSDEPFPDSFAPYKIVVYGAGGNRLGAHQIDQGLLAGRDNTDPLLISTAAADSALGVTGHETLGVSLPATGQLCFTAGSSESPVDCVAWGCVTSKVGAAAAVPAPPNGKSVQLQNLGSTYHLANPTPKDANVAGTTAKPCPDDPGPGPGPKKPTAGPDTLTGTPAANTICGLGGNDTIRGLAGGDTLYGGDCGDRTGSGTPDGNDVLEGGDGADGLFGASGGDTLRGGKGKDTLVGGKGKDVLAGGKGRNSYKGGKGNDTLKARNGTKETVDCGDGNGDTATVDESDTVKGCETVKRPT
jgi:hypothetical protein